MDTFASGDHTTTESTEAQEPTTALSFKVGEREYDAESAVKKIEHADNYIAELKAKEAEYQKRLAEMEAQLAQSTKLEDALSKLQQQQVTPSEHTTQSEVGTNVESQEDVVKRILQQREAEQAKKQEEEARKATFQEVQQALTNAYGADNVDKVVREKAQEIGIDFETALEMAQDPKKSKALLKLFDIGATRQQAAPLGQINTSGLKPKQEQKPISKMTAVEMAAYMKQQRQKLN